MSVNRVWKMFNNAIIDVIDEAYRKAKDNAENSPDVILIMRHDTNLFFSIESQLPQTTKRYGNIDK